MQIKIFCGNDMNVVLNDAQCYGKTFIKLRSLWSRNVLAISYDSHTVIIAFKQAVIIYQSWVLFPKGICERRILWTDKWDTSYENIWTEIFTNLHLKK